MKIFFASDHAGFELKEQLVEFVRTLDHEAEDLGAHTLDPEDDYPDFVMPLARAVASDATSRGVILGGSGQGEAMCVNRVPGIRAAVFYGSCRDVRRPDMTNTDIVKLAREHNDANLLSLGARFVTLDDAQEAIRIFLDTSFSNDLRHARRLAKF